MNPKIGLAAAVSLGSFALAVNRAVALHHASNATEAGLNYGGLIAMIVCGVVAAWVGFYHWYKS
ncbi:MAG TPA: hypothetical protein V6C89_01535 [Drouetiella sp.]|jgi:hypothetical protein